MSQKIRCTHDVDIFQEWHLYEEVDGTLYLQGQLEPLDSTYYRKYPEYFITLLPFDIEDIEPTQIDIKLDALERRFEKLHKIWDDEEKETVWERIQELEELRKDHF